MATSIAQVTVTRVAPDGGFAVTCPACPYQETRASRFAADYLAVEHQRAHVTSTTGRPVVDGEAN